MPSDSADLARLLAKKLTLPQIKTVWHRVFGETFDEKHPGADLDVAATYVVSAAERRNAQDKLEKVLRGEFPHVLPPVETGQSGGTGRREQWTHMGRWGSLSRIGQTIRQTVRAADSRKGFVMFQGDLTIDRTTSFLLRLRHDTRRGLPCYLPLDRPTTGNWSTGMHVDISAFNWMSNASDPTGAQRAGACLDELLLRLDADRKAPTFIDFVQANAFTDYFLVHALDGRLDCDWVETHLEGYVRLWDTLTPTTNRDNLPVRFLLIFRVDLNPRDPSTQGARERLEQTAHRLGIAIDAVGEAGVFIRELENIEKRDLDLTQVEFEEQVNEALESGLLRSPEDAERLIEMMQALNERFFPADLHTVTTWPMGTIEPEVLKVYNAFHKVCRR